MKRVRIGKARRDVGSNTRYAENGVRAALCKGKLLLCVKASSFIVRAISKVLCVAVGILVRTVHIYNTHTHTVG